MLIVRRRCPSASFALYSDADKEPADARVRFYEDHEDSVYGLAWSPGDAWLFCTLSYDGKVFANHVPSPEKYKILL
jgi:WD40 repeat protein